MCCCCISVRLKETELISSFSVTGFAPALSFTEVVVFFFGEGVWGKRRRKGDRTLLILLYFFPYILLSGCYGVL